MSQHLRRRTLACALCRKRKVKCDPSSLPCSPCRKLGAACLGGDIDSATRRESPRSLFLWLQNEVASLDDRMPERAVRRNENDTSRHEDHGPPRHEFSLGNALGKDFCYPLANSTSDPPLPGFVLLSEARLPSLGMNPRSPESSDTVPCGPEAVDPLLAIPERVAYFLLEAYISRSMQAYPIFHEPWLRSCYEATFGKKWSEGSPTLYQLFILRLVMAISLSSAARAKQAQARDMAFRLFLRAKENLPEVLTNDFAGLQALLLLQVYSMMNPTAANVYFTCGYSMQLCIELGLHREDAISDDPDFRVRDLKRRVMWSAWELEAACSNGLARPLALYPDDITTQFPAEVPDDAIHATCIDHEAKRSKFICAQVRRFRMIEAEVVRALFLDGPIISAEEFKFWAADVEQRIHTWKNAVHHAASLNTDLELAAPWEEMAVFSDIADPLVLMTLYRPSTRGPRPTTANLLKAFEAGIQVAKGYLKQANMAFGSPKYTFQPCHHVFSSAMLFLHVIREHAPQLATTHTVKDIEGSASLFSEYFSQISERWPAALHCQEEYERLLEPLMGRYMQVAGVVRSSIAVEELDAMLVDTSEPLYEPFEFPDAFGDITLGTGCNSHFLDLDENPFDWEGYFDFESYGV